MNGNSDVLIIDDDKGVQQTLETILRSNYSVRVASSAEEGLGKCQEAFPDLVLLDVMLPQMSGIMALRALRQLRSDLPVIMMTAFAQVHTAVEAIKLGATDYVEKPFCPQRLLDQVSHVMKARLRNRKANRSGIIGESLIMSHVWRLVERFAPTDVPVLFQGETGTGKGIFARALHDFSKRNKAPFVDIDCSTIPEQLAESELFGYEDGAFTGAGKKKPGRVVFADHGTLFLDELGILNLSTQAKLLTLIEQQGFTPLGARGRSNRRLDLRFIAATNVPLLEAVEKGSFRGDLYHRLNGITIELPPLRQRGDDVQLLAMNFLKELRLQYGKPDLEFSPQALELLRGYSWPGNVRELQRVISAAVIMADASILPEDLPESVRELRKSMAAAASASVSADPSIMHPDLGTSAEGAVIDLGRFKEWVGREAQKRVIEELQKRTNANHQELARMLRVDPKTLRARLKGNQS